MSDRIVERRGFRYVQLKTGRLITFWDAMTAAETAHTDLGRAISRVLKLAGDDWDLERLERRLDCVEEHVRQVRVEIEKRRVASSKRERIALLRNTSGRTPEEAAAYRRKADELEGRISA